MPLPPTFQFKTLQRTTNADDYKLYIASLEWDLLEPIVIRDHEDLRSKTNWREKIEPYHHQVTNLVTFCRRLPVTLLADDVGLGKTISAGLVMSELMARSYVTKILVICPKLLMPQWAEELKTKFGIESIQATGQELLHASPPGDSGAVITTYHSARIYLDDIADSGFQMLILDEAHKLRNLYGTPNPPQVALQFQQALANRWFKYVLMLTATPIQNRLWDIYSLVDLLTTARGHENPFGSEGMFVRNYIADSRTEARQLKEDAKDEFRNIVYRYMSRTRRSDAMLHFPEREVQLHKVNPSIDELKLIEIISEPIQELNRLVQISILQALVSSPQALSSQLQNSARKGTIPKSLAEDVKNIVDNMPISAKLKGLGLLIDQLAREQGNCWRVVIFTERRETQTTIEAFLGEKRISCGLINGDSGLKNQETIRKFNCNPPKIHAIISTRAGSEGVNLQAANVLVNYDLPWNPMIVEQRIGRIQRLMSNYANVCIFNIVLSNTFEEYIVGRLMEKLQMASHAIGDIEALLEAAGMDDEDNVKGFEELIRELVIASLAGKNVEEEAKLAADSINLAKVKLIQEEKNINSLLGGMNVVDFGPQPPDLPPLKRSLTEQEFTIRALKYLGADLTKITDNVYSVKFEGRSQIICFENKDNDTSYTLCKAGTTFFDRLVSKITTTPKYIVEDLDKEIFVTLEKLAIKWVTHINCTYKSFKIKEAKLCFIGTAVLRVDISLAHDKYERLLELECTSNSDFHKNPQLLQPIKNSIEDPKMLGLPVEYLKGKVLEDQGIKEFCRFYLERLNEEKLAVKENPIKLKKLEDDFTPQIEIKLVGLSGNLFREIGMEVFYEIDTTEYESSLFVLPSTGSILQQPKLETCSLTNLKVPRTCLSKCQISNKDVLSHKLIKSELTNRYALFENTDVCCLSGKRVLSDELEISDISGKKFLLNSLKASALSGKKAENEFFDICEFTKSDVLKTEISVSQLSGKKYRNDQELTSVVTGKSGHKTEFIYCSETNKPLHSSEAEKCGKTNKIVVPGILESCEITGKRVLPSLLENCLVTNKKALKEYFVSSSICGGKVLQKEAIKSKGGAYCFPSESIACAWSGTISHPDDLKICGLTGLYIRSEYLSSNQTLITLHELLKGTKKRFEQSSLWTLIGKTASNVLDAKSCKVETAELSPDKKYLAVCLEVRSWFGLKVTYAGFIYSINDNTIVGSLEYGKRKDNLWIKDDR